MTITQETANLIDTLASAASKMRFMKNSPRSLFG